LETTRSHVRPGSLFGSFFARLAVNSMGNVGSLILLAGFYVATLILMTGLRPIHLIRETVH